MYVYLVLSIVFHVSDVSAADGWYLKSYKLR